MRGNPPHYTRIGARPADGTPTATGHAGSQCGQKRSGSPGVIHSSMISHSLRALDFTDVLLARGAVCGLCARRRLVAQTSPSRPSPRGSGSTSSIRIETTPTAIATGDARHISTVSRPLWWVARSRDRVLEDGQLVEQPDGRRAAGVAEHRGVILPRAPRGAPCREQWRARSNRSSRAPLTHHSPHTHTPTGGCSRRYWPGWAARGACGPVKRAGVLCGWDSR